MFLEGPSAVGATQERRSPSPAAPDVEHITTTATLPQHDQPDRHVSRHRTSPPARTITVTNLNNGHSVTCTATRVYIRRHTGLIVCTDTFAQIADLTDAPIPVEITSVTHSRPTIRELLESNHLAPRRDLGQNFVADPNTVRRIAELAGSDRGDHVVEIGAGLGSLTLASPTPVPTITAIEVDRGIVPLLREVVGRQPERRQWSKPTRCSSTGRALARRSPTRWVLVANLPYNVATPLVCDMLDGVPADPADARHGAARGPPNGSCAEAADRGYGAVSVKVAYWATARIVGTCPASVFVPRPNVESGVGRDHPRPTRRVDATRAYCSAGQAGVRSAAQDVAPIARPASSPRAVRGGRRRAQRRARGARRRRVVPAG